MEKIETILTGCIQEIKAGKATLSECMDRYPERRRKLEPLIKLALNIHEPERFQLDTEYKQAAKARLLQQIRTVSRNKSESFSDARGFRMPLQFNRVKFAVSLVVAVIVISMLAGGTVYAAQDSLPGDLVYPVKTGAEDIRLLLAGSTVARVELNMKFAWTRLEEMSELASADEEKAEIAVQGYEGRLEAAGQQIRGITDTPTRSQLLVKVLGNLKAQVDFCDNVIDAAPMYTGLVREAGTLSVIHHVRLLEMLAQDDILKAAQINLNAMQDRLERAQTGAASHEYQSMQQALDQYMQFNRVASQVMERARSTGNQDDEIHTLYSQMIPGYLNILDGIYQLVPQEYRNDIEISRRMTLQFQTQAYHGDQQKDGSGSGSEGPNSEDGGGPATEQTSQGTPQNQDGNVSPGAEAPGTGPGDAPAPGPGGGGDGDSSGSGSAPSPGPGGSP